MAPPPSVICHSERSEESASDPVDPQAHRGALHLPLRFATRRYLCLVGTAFSFAGPAPAALGLGRPRGLRPRTPALATGQRDPRRGPSPFANDRAGDTPAQLARPGPAGSGEIGQRSTGGLNTPHPQVETRLGDEPTSRSQHAGAPCALRPRGGMGPTLPLLGAHAAERPIASRLDLLGKCMVTAVEKRRRGHRR